MERNIMQDLHTLGLNPFAAQLLAESVLKSPIAPESVADPKTFFFPVHRSDCLGWCGVRITFEAVPEGAPTPAKVTALQETYEVRRIAYLAGEVWLTAHGQEVPQQLEAGDLVRLVRVEQAKGGAV
jgi:hypothetical protein